jgi:hypothetical protein
MFFLRRRFEWAESTYPLEVLGCEVEEGVLVVVRGVLVLRNEKK